jgi:hypothetical protein
MNFNANWNGRGLKGKGAAASPAVKKCTRKPERTAVKKPRRHIEHCNGASGLAASQPRKPEAAHIVDWVYVRSSFTYDSPNGDCDCLFQIKRS